MVDLYTPGSFNDAMRYGWESLPKILKRWWPLYIIVYIGAVAGWYFSSPLLSIFIGLLSGSILIITCAVQFRGSLRDSPWLIRGFALTFILLHIVLGVVRLLQPKHVPYGAAAFVYLIAFGLYAWISSKLQGAAYVFLLADEGEAAVDAYAIAWNFIAGEVWWRCLFIAIVGLVPTVLASLLIIFLLHFITQQPPLLILRWVGPIVTTPFAIFLNSALFRIVGTAPQLRARYREAYQQ